MKSNIKLLTTNENYFTDSDGKEKHDITESQPVTIVAICSYNSTPFCVPWNSSEKAFLSQMGKKMRPTVEKNVPGINGRKKGWGKGNERKT